jgi:hypothetical protein
MKIITCFFIVLSLLVICGCAYRHYLGMHGPSIKAYQDIHEGVKEDTQCLTCHDPDNNPQGPETSHPGFKGCFKCHND